MPEHGSRERRERAARPAPRGHVAAPEIRHHVDAGSLREPRGIIELDREAHVGPMPYGLTVATDRRDAAPCSRRPRRSLLPPRAYRSASSQADRARKLERIPARLGERQYLFAQRPGKRDGGEGESAGRCRRKNRRARRRPRRGWYPTSVRRRARPPLFEARRRRVLTRSIVARAFAATCRNCALSVRGYRFGLGQRHAKRVLVDAGHPEFVVQVRPRGPARHADKSDHLSLVTRVPECTPLANPERCP